MPMDFTGARDRVRRMIASKKPQELQRSALTPDVLRDNVVDAAARDSERFRAQLRKQPEIEWEQENEDGSLEQRTYTWDTFPEAMRDVARAHFGFDEPEITGAEHVRASHQLNREVVSAYLGSEAFQESRPYSRGNELESLFGALAAKASLEESAQTRLAEHVKRSEEMGEQEQEAIDAQNAIDNLRELAKQQIDAAGQVDDQTKRRIKDAVKARQAAREKLHQLLQQQAASSIVADANAAANAAAQAAGEAVDACGALELPGLGGGAAHNLTPDQQLALAEKWANNEALREIARMIGRMYRSMRFKRETRTKNVPIEPVGVTTGRDIQRLLPHEHARAYSDHPLVKATFAKDFAEHGLLQYDMDGKIPAGKGPIIEVHDGSGSMTLDFGGVSRFVWASSVAGALLTMARREKRDFAGVEFGSPGQVKSWFFPKAESPDPNEVVDFISHFYGGGTSTVSGMAEALRIVREAPAFRTADIVLIGDGQDYFRENDQAIRSELRALQVRIHGISIACPDNAYMAQMCDYTVDVADLAQAREAEDRIAENLT